MLFTMTVFAYLGPETMLPMTSAVAGAVGLAMLFGRNALRFASGAARRLVAMIRPKAKPRAGAKVRKIGAGPVGGVGAPGLDRARTRSAG